MTEEEVDEQIERLKGELDEVATRIKRAIQDRGPSRRRAFARWRRLLDRIG